MKIIDILSRYKRNIAGEWLRQTMGAYPAEGLKILQKNEDQFANPLFYLISEGIEKLFEELLKGAETKEVTSILEQVVKIKAVQDFDPSQSLEFIFFLKDIIRERLKKDLPNEDFSGELYIIERRIDKIALIAFDIYMKSRERLFEIQAQEVKNQTYMLIRQANEVSKQKRRGKK